MWPFQTRLPPVETEVHARNALAPQREFHAASHGVRNQAKALFGPNSDQVAAPGLKKKAERKSPVRVGRAAEARGE